jgi:photosystem II stability/assembly factor-like uncharacterized protein
MSVSVEEEPPMSLLDRCRCKKAGALVSVLACVAIVLTAAMPSSSFAYGISPKKKPPVPPAQYVSVSFPDRTHGFALASKGSSWFLLSTANNGRNWRSRRLSILPFGPLQFVDKTHGWLLGRYAGNCSRHCSSYVFATVNGGRSWKKQTKLRRQNAGEMEFVSDKKGWVLDSACRGCSERVLQTSNGGRKWRPAGWKLTQVDAFAFLKRGFGWATVYQVHKKKQTTTLYLTTNWGKKWKRSLSVPAYEVWPTFANRKVGQILISKDGLCSLDGCILKLERTTNGGKRWRSQYQVHERSNGIGGFPEAVWFPDAVHGWMALNAGAAPHGGGVAVTTNGGRTWKASAPLSCYRNLVPTSVAVTGPKQVWVAGGNLGTCARNQLGLAHTTDSGRHWKLMAPKR